MKRLALMAGALMLVATFVTSGSYAVEPVKTRPSVQVQTVTGMPVTTVGWRGYGRGYYGGPRGYYGYYGPRYRSNYYYGPSYRTNYYRGYSYPPTYYGPSYYGPSYYGRPGGAVNVYPGGVDVGGVHVGW